jgi:uncharacterized protein DUF3179
MKRLLSVCLILLTLVSLSLVLIPALLIRPFTAQSSTGLRLSYQLRNLNPMFTLWLLAAALLPIVFLWIKNSSWKTRSFVLAAGTFLLAAAILSRQNLFEWMFHPAPPAKFLVAAQSTHVKDSDIVLGVDIGNESRAYPVRMIAYHHLINDSISGTPIVVTY